MSSGAPETSANRHSGPFLSNPELELAGVVVSSAGKVGKDAGELCATAPTGVLATDDADAALGGADAVAYCASGDFRPDEALDDIERCLRAGKDVVSTSVYPLYDPKSAPDDVRERFEAACSAGNSSLFVSGIDPGFINHLLPLVMSGFCEEIEEIRGFEIFNYATYNAPDAVRDLVGFGTSLDNVPPMVLPGVPTMVWGGTIRLLARALGAELDDIRETSERLPLEETVTVPVGTFEKGTQGALRFEVQGIVGGRPAIVVEHVTRIHDDAAPDWPKSADGHGAHGVRITGRPNIELSIESEYPGGDRVSGGNTTAAAHVVNAIPHVCAAGAGLLDLLDLPLVYAPGIPSTRGLGSGLVEAQSTRHRSRRRVRACRCACAARCGREKSRCIYRDFSPFGRRRSFWSGHACLDWPLLLPRKGGRGRSKCRSTSLQKAPGSRRPATISSARCVRSPAIREPSRCARSSRLSPLSSC